MRAKSLVSLSLVGLSICLVLLTIVTANWLLLILALSLFANSIFNFRQPADSANTDLAKLEQWLNNLSTGNKTTIPEQGRVAAITRQIEGLLVRAKPTLDDINSSEPHADTLLTQTRSLGVLYDIAAGVNVSRDLDDLLNRFLEAVSKIADTRAVAVRLLDGEDQLVLAAQVGLDTKTIQGVHKVPVTGTSSGKAITERRVVWQDDKQPTTLGAAETLMRENPELLMVSVPLQYRQSTVGVYNVFVDRRHVKEREPLEELFLSIGRHLGIAIEKTRLEREAYHFHIMQERSRFSAELHDSLAQTLASLRFQVRVLEDDLNNNDEVRVRSMLERIERAVTDANTELRGLIAHFRAPIDRRGLIPAIKTAVDRFREETGVVIFMQSVWPESPLEAAQELHVLRIIQESLVNIRKHASASAVRVFLGTEGAHLKVIVEDDGVGFDQSSSQGSDDGHHIGLGIMTTRAEQLGGELVIDSEPDEGTRILLKFLPRSAGIVDDSGLKS